MIEIIRAILKTGGAALFSIIFGMITTKVIAIVGGPSATGFFSLTKQMQQTLVGLATMQGNIAIVQGVSARASDSDKKRYIASVALVMSILCLASILGVVFFAQEIIECFFKNDLNLSALNVMMFSAMILFGAITIFQNGVLNAYRAIGKLGVVQVVGALIMALASYPVYQNIGGVAAALIVLISMSVGNAVVGYIFLKRKIYCKNGSKRLIVLPNWADAKSFLSFAGTTSLTSFIGTGTLLTMRTMFMRWSGAADTGIFDAAITCSNMYLMILLTSLSTYYLPVLSTLHETKERNKFIEKILRLIILLGGPLVAGMILLKPFVIIVLYSKEFLQCIGMLQWMLIGGFLKLISWVLAMPMLAYMDKKTFILSELVANALLISFTWGALYIFNDMGIVGIGYLVMNTVYLAYFCRYSSKRFGVVISKRTISYSIISIGLIIGAAVFSWGRTVIQFDSILIEGIAFLIYSYFFITVAEKKAIVDLLRKKFS